MPVPRLCTLRQVFATTALLAALWAGAPSPAAAQVTAFKQAVAEAVAEDDGLAAFYRGRGFEGVWTGRDDAAIARRNAVLTAFGTAEMHGLPPSLFDARQIMTRMQAASTPAERGAIDVELSRLYLLYARSVQSGILDPRRVSPHIKREVVYTSADDLLGGLMSAEQPDAFLRSLPPRSPEYARLMREKMRLERALAEGGWGPQVRASRLEQGDSGADVVDLRNRLILMGYLDRTPSQSFGGDMRAAVEAFQAAHGLAVDGVVGGDTLAALNVDMAERLQQVLVSMERERWINRPGGLGQRHIWVNLTDFTAAIVDDDIVTFRTRSVIGAREDDRETPEFSDEMDHMVINPSWYVPRSIVTKEYLPQLQRNAGAVGHIDVTDSRGRVVSRGAVNFNAYTASSFPFSMRQSPGPRNALGTVKFMFPNRYNIYLHDTPAKSLFAQTVRAFSHGCIRLNDPHDFAYALLAPQTEDPQDFFQSRLRTGAETRVNLDQPVPVHIVYRTAFTDASGGLHFRGDIYGRDRAIWAALSRAGVTVGGVQG